MLTLLGDPASLVFIPGDVFGEESENLRRLPSGRGRSIPTTPAPSSSEPRLPEAREFASPDSVGQEKSRTRRRLPGRRSLSNTDRVSPIPSLEPPPTVENPLDKQEEAPESGERSGTSIRYHGMARLANFLSGENEISPAMLSRGRLHSGVEKVSPERLLLAQSDEPQRGRRLPSGRSRPTLEKPDRQRTRISESAGSPEQLAQFQRSNFIPIRDRWRIGYTGSLLDPYAQNLLKADYPIIGQDIFFNFTGISESLFEARRLPTPQGISRRDSGSAGDFFGKGRQLFFNQNFVTSFEIFKGDTGFRPRDWAIRVTPVFNVNYLNVRERGIVNLDVREGTTRTDHQIAFQEAFVEYKFLDVSRNFDFASVRAGIQGFTSDFRGFIFADNEPGIRFFGNFLNNRYQWNIAYFYFLEKDTNSMLNSFERRHRQVVIANIYKQDFIWKGYTTQLSFHYDRDEAGNEDSGGGEIDSNGFPVRPARLGTLRPNNIYSYYLGWTGDGHIGRINISHAFYQVFGDVDQEPIAGRSASINAQMAALELSYDIDWWRPKVSVFYGSGDRNPTDGVARGFDSILDNVNFAGNGFSFYNRQGIPLSQTGVFLVNRLSLLNDFRSSKIQGQSQFVNPGVILVNAGVDVEATPKLKVLANFNYLWFATTAPIEHVLNQSNIRQAIGQDYSLGLIYRPLLNQNIILTAGFAYLVPNGGLKDIQGGDDLYSTFFSAVLTF